ncbi:hypothetical protein F5880DRAFT_1613722 [Lentinula raphanica]|nr:hypothetical protein F5880DRAFT_1613722 [Lentinula raphanica]
MGSRALSFINLPVELVCDVLQLLSIRDLLQCNLVCKRLQKIINESSALQFTIELSRCRMVPNLTSELSFSARLRLLRDRENAWKTLNPTSRHQMKLAHSGTIYEFSGGVYGVGKESNHRTAYITFYDLPSSASGEQLSTTHHFPDVNVVDFTMDPTQDLLVLVALNSDSSHMYNLHLRKLSTNEPHPSAPAPILPCHERRLGLDTPDNAVQIQIFGDAIGILVKESLLSLRAHFEIFKWRNVFPNSCQVKSLVGIDDFSFLSDDHFLLAQPNGMLDVYSFAGSISDENNPVYRASYELPALSPAYSFWYISLSSNPIPGYSGHAGEGEQKAYHCSPTNRIHACCLYVYQPSLPDGDTVYPFVFFFHPQALLNYQHHLKMSSTRPDLDQYLRRKGINKVHIHDEDDDDVPSSSNLNDTGLPSPDTEPSSPHSGHHSSGSFVLFDSTSSELLDFFTPQATNPGSSSMLFDVSPTSSEHMLSPGCQTPALPVPWEAWGPPNTRWFRGSLSQDWQRSVYGLRSVDCVVDRAALDSFKRGDARLNQHSETDQNDSEPDTEHDSGSESDEDGFVDVNEIPFTEGDIERQLGCTVTLPKFVRVRDFNPYSVSKALDELPPDASPLPNQTRSSPKLRSPVDRERAGFVAEMVRDRGGHKRVVTEATTMNVRNVFMEDVSSSLPYVETISKDDFNVNEAMMDDCRILLVKRDKGRNSKGIIILDM